MFLDRIDPKLVNNLSTFWEKINFCTPLPKNYPTYARAVSTRFLRWFYQLPYTYVNFSKNIFFLPSVILMKMNLYAIEYVLTIFHTRFLSRIINFKKKYFFLVFEFFNFCFIQITRLVPIPSPLVLLDFLRK